MKEFAYFVKLQARNLKRNLIMDSFRGISQRYFLDFELIFMTFFNPKNAVFPGDLLMAASVKINKESLTH